MSIVDKTDAFSRFFTTGHCVCNKADAGRKQQRPNDLLHKFKLVEIDYSKFPMDDMQLGPKDEVVYMAQKLRDFSELARNLYKFANAELLSQSTLTKPNHERHVL